jgi:hypothetical protein
VPANAAERRPLQGEEQIRPDHHGRRYVDHDAKIAPLSGVGTLHTG